MVMKNMVSMSYIVAHLGQAELDCTVTLRERKKQYGTDIPDRIVLRNTVIFLWKKKH